jgi:protein-L-isoaspartate O-methyltransferase
MICMQRLITHSNILLQGRENVAHTDQPLKEGNVHISAPHIYGSALEALELVPNSSMSFLNIGSGTGYVSCIVADILGSRSSHYGIEIHADVVQHSRAAIERWTRATTSSPPSIQIIHGNGLDVLPTRGESVFGFDRIYVGAAVERRNLNKLSRLLRPGGILVGPGTYCNTSQ